MADLEELMLLVTISVSMYSPQHARCNQNDQLTNDSRKRLRDCALSNLSKTIIRRFEKKLYQHVWISAVFHVSLFSRKTCFRNDCAGTSFTIIIFYFLGEQL